MEQSSSEEIIASLINDVQKANTPFDVKILIEGHKTEAMENGKRSASLSPLASPVREKREKRHKSKKSKKNRKKRTASESLSRKRRHKSGEGSNSEEGAKRERSAVDKKASELALDMDTQMEKISDDDDLPVGADFQSISGPSVKQSVEVTLLKQEDFSFGGTGANKRREFDHTEEVFPLAKAQRKRNRSESPPDIRKAQPRSEVLSKVCSDRNSPLVPRNIKLKQDSSKSSQTATDLKGFADDEKPSSSHGALSESSARRSRTSEADSEEYGPKPAISAPPAGPMPISEDDDDELQLYPPVVKPQITRAKIIKIGSIRKSTIANLRRERFGMGEDGEVPVSDESSASNLGDTSRRIPKQESNKKIKEEGEARRTRPSSKPAVSSNCTEPRDSSQTSKHDRKRKKDKKKSRKESRKKGEGASSSSDSENEWKQLESSKPKSENKEAKSSEKSTTKSDKGKRSGERDNSDRASRRSAEVNSNGTRETRHRRSKSSRHGRKHRSVNQSDEASTSVKDDSKLVSTLRRPNMRWNFRGMRSSFSPEWRWRSRFWSKSKSRSASRSSASSHNSGRSKSHRRKKRQQSEEAQSDECKIDKKKLLEIAQRNVAQMAQLGYLPNSTSRGPLQPGSAQSVDQLVDFCQKLQRSQDKAERREKGEKVSTDEEEGVTAKKRKDENEFLKHPFALKPAAPITINITNLRPAPPRAVAVDEEQLCLSFPVSSGVAHQQASVTDQPSAPTKLEEPDEDKSQAVKENEIVCVTPAPSKAPSEDISGGAFLLPPPPKPPVLLASFTTPPSALLNLPPPPPPPTIFSPTSIPGVDSVASSIPTASLGLQFLDSVSTTNETAFEGPTNSSVAIADVRLDPNRGLSEDSDEDLGASAMLQTAEELLPWVTNRFAGSRSASDTDVLNKAKKVTGVGLKLLQKMGWTPGEGLGKDRDGRLEPLAMQVKLDRRGLVAAGESSRSHPKADSGIPVDTTGKHPVSALMELCSKKRWPILFDCEEMGPPNNRRYRWTVTVNWLVYMQPQATSNKKEGKAQTCQMVLDDLRGRR